MALRIIRNDITKMEVDAIVNTANEEPIVGDGCDTAVYNAAGRENLLALRKQIGHIDEGEAAITPGLALPARYIIHAVSPFYIDGDEKVEGKLRNCYKNSFKLAVENDAKSIAFPLISTGSFGYPNEEGMRIAIDEINAFLMQHDMDVYLVVFDGKMTDLGKRIDPDLESYIDERYMEQLVEEEYSYSLESVKPKWHGNRSAEPILMKSALSETEEEDFDFSDKAMASEAVMDMAVKSDMPVSFDDEKDSLSLDEHLKHLSDTFSSVLILTGLIISRPRQMSAHRRSLISMELSMPIRFSMVMLTSFS